MIARLALPALAVPLAPLLAAQALWVRRTTPRLPRPLRTVMGLRARALDEVIARVVGERYAPAELPVEAECFFAADGFHPSVKGYQAWAAALLSNPGLPIYRSTY
ncbi:hypothetical protein AB0B45_06670 [Nonomuraea sp. NPDC049152]|uniref:hypothetical protein n=1 Tax=Nonomuraea sp. NPDC049152 TaxID=3154350 RepID=UPI0034026E2E